MKRKILSLILVFAMTVSLLTVGTGAVEPTYGDTAGHWAESSIERWSGHGIIQGSNGLFDPNGQLTCAQLATILAKLLKLPAAKDAGFSDNTADAWYYDAINRCAAAGILNGNGDGTVTPEAPITRERAMVMLARALGIEPIRKPDLTKYTDAAQVSAYAQGYVAALIEAGIVGGVTADQLAPQDSINRASTVTILDRAIGTYADKAGATVKADGKGIVLVVADDVTVTGDVDKLLVPADNVDVTVSGSKNIDDITVTGDNSKVILNNSTANDVTLDGKNSELATKSGSKVENVSVTEDAKGATVNAGSGTTIKNVENSAADTTVTGSGTVKNVASDTDITVETKNTNVKNIGDEKITVTDKSGKDTTIGTTGSGSSTVVNKETTSSGGGYSHSHSYDTSKWVFDDTTHWYASTCGHNLKIDEATHTYNENNVCTVCGQVKVDVAVAKIGSQNYKTLPEAVAAAQSGDTVKLVGNISTVEGIGVAKKITLDMAGRTITSSVKQVFTVTGSGDLTITGNGTISGPAGEAAKALDGKAVLMVSGESAKLTVLNGTITAGGVVDCGMYGIYVADGGNVILGDADTKTGPTIKTWFAAVGENNTTSPANITIYGGEYTAQAAPAESDRWAYFCAPVYASASGNITISGGTFNGYYGISSRYVNVGQNLNISGGTFNGSNSALFVDTKSGVECSETRTIAITGGTFSSDPSAYVADGYVAMKNDNGTWTVIAPTAIENGVTIKGIAGYERYAFSSVSKAYDEISPKVAALGGLGQEICSAEVFNAFYTDNGKITWTIYGKQTLVGKDAKDSQNNDIVVDNNSLTFGRAASYYGDCSLTKIEVKAGNESAALDLSATNGTFALPYNWWGQTVKNIEISFTGITFDGIKSIPGTWATPEQETPYTFDRCTFNGSVYGYHDYNINLTIKNSTFNAPDNTQYAIMLQSTTGISGKVTLDKNTFNGYTRGVNLQRPGTDFIFTNNTITSTVSEPDRAAIQLTDGKSFTVTGNTVRVNAGNAFWFHEAAKNSDVEYTISGNDIDAPYIGYYATSFDVNRKITSSGNNFNNTDTTLCMKKDATVAEATNLTAIR